MLAVFLVQLKKKVVTFAGLLKSLTPMRKNIMCLHSLIHPL